MGENDRIVQSRVVRGRSYDHVEDQRQRLAAKRDRLEENARRRRARFAAEAASAPDAPAEAGGDDEVVPGWPGRD